MLPSKVPINMEQYPHIKELSKEEAGPLVSSVFKTLNEAIEKKYDKASVEYFGKPIQDIMSELLEAMFDHKGIISHLPNQTNAETLSEIYGHTLNPLHAAFTKDNLLDSKGNPVTFEEKFGLKEGEFSVKKWLQGLLFYSYYCSLADLAQYLALDDYSLMEEEKHENIAKLIEVRPVLEYQKRVGILPGKLIPETGFFQGGDLFEDTEICPACRSIDQLVQVTEELTVCVNCKAGYER